MVAKKAGIRSKNQNKPAASEIQEGNWCTKDEDLLP